MVWWNGGLNRASQTARRSGMIVADAPGHGVGVGSVDILAWLTGLGLERYAQTFRDHEVDLEVLGELAEGDLEKLGIPLGHRKKLLKAIARLAPAAGRRRRAPRPSGAS